MKMVAVKGIYEGGNTVRIDGSELSISEPYEVIVSFLQPAKQSAEKQAGEDFYNPHNIAHLKKVLAELGEGKTESHALIDPEEYA